MRSQSGISMYIEKLRGLSYGPVGESFDGNESKRVPHRTDRVMSYSLRAYGPRPHFDYCLARLPTTADAITKAIAAANEHAAAILPPNSVPSPLSRPSSLAPYFLHSLFRIALFSFSLFLSRLAPFLPFRSSNAISVRYSYSACSLATPRTDYDINTRKPAPKTRALTATGRWRAQKEKHQASSTGSAPFLKLCSPGSVQCLQLRYIEHGRKKSQEKGRCVNFPCAHSLGGVRAFVFAFSPTVTWA